MAANNANDRRAQIDPGLFTRAVRLNVVAQPSHAGRFSAEAWDALFAKSSPHTAADEALHFAGHWFAGHFEGLRRRAAALALVSPDRESLVRMQVGAVNRDSALIGRLVITRDQGMKLVTSDEMIGGRYRDPRTGTPVHPADLLESAVGGLKYALDNLRLHEATHKPAGRIPPPEELTNALRANSLLGSMWNSLVDAWADCVWNAWSVDASGQVDVVRPPMDVVEDAKTVSRYRQDTLGVEATHRAFAAWSRVARDTSRETVVRAEGSGKHRRFLYSATSSDDAPPRAFVFGAVTEALYFQGLLDAPLPKYGKLTLRSFTEAWDALAAVAEALASRAPSADSGVAHPRRLLEWAPTLSTDELEEPVRRRTGCSVEEASQLVRAFVRSEAEYREEVWFRPIVELRGGRHLLVNDALVLPNLQRSIEHWAKLGGLDLAARGPLFERYARQKMGEAIQASRLLRDARIVPRNLST